MPSCVFLLDFLKEDQRERKGLNRMGRNTRFCLFYCKERCGRNLLERGRGKRQGDVMPSCAFLLGFLEKKKTTGKGKGWRGREGRQGYALLLQGTLWDKLFRRSLLEREKGTIYRGMSCLLVPSYCTFLRQKKEEDKREKEGGD